MQDTNPTPPAADEPHELYDYLVATLGRDAGERGGGNHKASKFSPASLPRTPSLHPHPSSPSPSIEYASDRDTS